MSSGMDLSAKGIHATNAKGPFEATSFTRHQPGPKDVVLSVKYCGVCHSDVHAAKDDPSPEKYPVMPGHEIAGVVEWVGSEVTKLKPGDHVGVGCMVDSCLDCEFCQLSNEQYCVNGATMTYGGEPKHGRAGSETTRGGYSTRMVVTEHFCVKVPKDLPLEVVGPILCAGVTVFDPLVHWKAGSEHVKKIGIAGGGGLGHMGIKLAKALGCEVTAITSSPKKTDALKELGASRVIVSTDEGAMKGAAKSLDLILNTISAPHDVMMYQALLRPNGTLVQLGLVGKPHSVCQVPLLMSRAGISGSLIAGMKATQELIEICTREKIWPSIEVVHCNQIDRIYDELMSKSSMPKRYVLDVANTMEEYCSQKQQ